MSYLVGFALYVAQALIALFLGGMFYWAFRKFRARFQARRGPPWYQSFLDLVKLFSKESIIPSSADRTMFIAAPILAFTGYLVTALMVSASIRFPAPLGFAGDLIVILIALSIPNIALILAGSSSSSPYGAVGASREASLLVAVEAPLIASALVPALSVGTLSLTGLIEFQAVTGPFLVKFPFAAAAFFICLLLKLGRKPFDIPEADVEIVAGPYTEYSGPLLGFFEVANVLKWFVVPALAVNLFLSGGGFLGSWVADILIFLALMVIVVALASYLDSQNPRWKVNQAFKHLLTWTLGLALIDVVRVALGVGLW